MKKIFSTKPLSLDYLIDEYGILFETSSYPGGEATIAEIIKKKICRYIDADFSEDVNGNLVVRINPSRPASIVLEAHIDRVAAGICNISNDGRLFIHSIGRLELNRYYGNLIYIINKNGEKIPAIVGGNTKLPGISSSNESVWLDAGNRQTNVDIGYIAQFLNRPKVLGSLLAASGLDNLAGVICLIETAKMSDSFDTGLILWFSSKEEIGAITLPELDLCKESIFVSVDTCFSSECNDIPASFIGRQSVGSGPIVLFDPSCNRELNDKIIQLASDYNICIQKYQNIVPGYGLTVTNSALAKLNAKRSCLLLPIRYMHSPFEVCSIEDIDKLIRLLSILVNEN